MPFGVDSFGPAHRLFALGTAYLLLVPVNRKLIETRAIVNGSVGGNVESAQMANDVVSFELPSAGLNTTES